MVIRKIVCAVSAIITSAILATVCIQNSSLADERYVNVGADDSDNPFLLDTKTMGKKEPGFGNVIEVYQIKSNLMSVILLNPACGDNRLWIVGSRTYSNGIKLTENKRRDEISSQGDSAGSTAMRYYCHSIGARGW